MKSMRVAEPWRRAGHGEDQRGKQKTPHSPAPRPPPPLSSPGVKSLQSHMLLMGLWLLRPISLQSARYSFLLIVAGHVTSNIK